jgi:threonine aldolase
MSVMPIEPTNAERPANFTSDTVSPAAPEIVAALLEASHGAAASYGADAISARVKRRLAEIFEHDVAVFPVATGTAANALALAACVSPWGALYCHDGAHIIRSEAGAPEFYAGGAKLLGIAGAHGKITLDAFARTLDAIDLRAPNQSLPQALSLTQATEAGTLYHRDEIGRIAERAHEAGMKVHMDGARFANAVAALDIAPAEITWRAGVDVLSFGVIKNGGLCGDAIVAFDPGVAEALGHLYKRTGHLFSKMRYLSAQIEAALIDGRWLGWARQANAMARRLADGLTRLGIAEWVHPVEVNILFVRLPEAVSAGLLADGFKFAGSSKSDPRRRRLVTSWNTDAAAVDYFLARAAHHAGARREPARSR